MAVQPDALSRCRECIDQKQSFLLQGGAGSGKTDSLKKLLLYIRETQPQARVVCITHTNAAVDEIVSRVGEGYVVSTIHSFLYELIKGYRKNIWQAMPELFKLEPFTDSGDHKQYKSLYKTCAKQLYWVDKTVVGAPVKKRDYKKAAASYDQTLNEMITELNEKIDRALTGMEPPKEFYNMTRFDRLRSGTFGHDGLLKIFHILFRDHELLSRIIRDKYDYIFIDEYQDTDAQVLKDLLKLPVQSGLTVALFGDHMQSIYEGGIDTLEPYIQDGTLKSIPKEDNYRCSYEVIDLINSLRSDDIDQKVAFKLKNGVPETGDDRHGSARVWYAVVENKPGAKSTAAAKKQYHELLEKLIAKARGVLGEESKVLILTNKEIAAQNGFPVLHKIFSDCFSDAKDRIEEYLHRIQAMETAELCRLYEQKDHNELICRVKQNGYRISSIQAKEELRQSMETLCTDQELSMWEALKKATEHHLIPSAEGGIGVDREKLQKTAPRYETFIGYYNAGIKKLDEMETVMNPLSKAEYDELDSIRKQEVFWNALRDGKLKFSEIRNYHTYLEEETRYITMHKTKGTSIPAVIVVMEEFFWNEYDFGLLYAPSVEQEKEQKKAKSEKLIYVACSRAARDLICLRILTPDEVDAFKQKFPQAELIGL